MANKNKIGNNDRVRLVVIAVISLFVIITGSLFAYKSFSGGDVTGGIMGILIAVVILGFAVSVYKRGNRSLKRGMPLEDERSKKVIRKASSLAFYVTLYLLLAIGFLSDSVLKFVDVSRAMSVAVGGMAFLFVVFWIYYNRKGV